MKNFGDVAFVSAWDDNSHRGNAMVLRMIHKSDKVWTEFDIAIPMSQGERLKAVPRPFIDYVRGLMKKTISAEEGSVSIEMLLGAYRSATEGCRILLPL
jgi:hypothetical protein